MFHHFTLSLFGYDVLFHTNTLMIEIFAVISVLIFTLSFRRERLMIRAFLLAVVVSVAAFMGARIFHLLVEKPIANFSWDRLLEFDGMTFYGSFILASLVATIGTYLFFPRSADRKILDLSALFFAFGYGFLRIGCFANGCCWGRLSSVPWAVRYAAGSEMPYIGLPVHPVQLYDAAVGFLVGFLLLSLYRRSQDQHPSYRGALMPIFMVLSSVGRFITEFFRGDSYRGTDVVFSLSTSQTVSVPLFFLGVLWLFFYFRRSSPTPSRPSVTV